MPLTYREVRDLYDALAASGVTTKSLEDWSRSAGPTYAAGFDDSVFKQGSVWLDRLLERTGIPERLAPIGREVGSWFGEPDWGEQFGRGALRSTLNFAPLMIPGGGWVGAAAKLGLTGLLQGSQTYTDTGSRAAGILSGITAAAMPKVSNVVEQAILRKMGATNVSGRIANVFADNVTPILDRGISTINRYIPQTRLQGLTSLLGGQLAAGTFGEVSGVGQQVLAGQDVTWDPKIALLNATIGNLPYSLPYLTKGGRVQFGGKTARAETARLQSRIAATEAALPKPGEATRTFDLSHIPDYEQQKVSPVRLAEIESRLDTIRGRIRQARRDNTPLSEEEWNTLSKEENDLIAESGLPEEAFLFRKDEARPETPRSVMLGREVWSNKAGTAKTIELPNGKLFRFSTLGMPDPVDDPSGYKLWSLPTEYMTDVTDRFGRKPDAKPDEGPTFDWVKDLDEAEAALNRPKLSVEDKIEALRKLNEVNEGNDWQPTTEEMLEARKRWRTMSTEAAILAETNKARRRLDRENARREGQERKAWEQMPERDKENIQRALVAQGKDFEDVPKFGSDNLAAVDFVVERLDRIIDDNPEWQKRIAALPEDQRRAATLAAERFKVYFPLRMLGDLGDGESLTPDQAAYFNSQLDAQGIGVTDLTELTNFPQQVSNLAKIVNATLKVMNSVAPSPLRYVPRSAGEGWLLSMGSYDPVTNELNGKKLNAIGGDREGNIGVGLFRNQGGLGGRVLTADEINLYRYLVPDAFSGEKVNVPKLVEGLKDRAPIVTTQAITMEGKVSEAKAELTKLTHEWFDNLSGRERIAAAAVERHGRNGTPFERIQSDLIEFGPEFVEKARRYHQLAEQVAAEPPDSSPRATSFYNQISSVDPKKVKQWGGESRKVVVSLPITPELRQAREQEIATGRNVLRDQRADYEKQVLWPPDDIHESGIPNVLGWAWTHELTYDFLKNEWPGFVEKHGLKPGDKVWLVDEQQSRWGQSNQKRTEQRKAELKKLETQLAALPEPTSGPRQPKLDLDRNILLGRIAAQKDILARDSADHPLLPLQHTLVLKAVIAEAAKRGVKRVVVSDAETAMMTEGHDKAAVHFVPATLNDVQNHASNRAEQYRHLNQSWNDIASSFYGSDWREGTYVKEGNAQGRLLLRIDKPEQNATEQSIQLAEEYNRTGGRGKIGQEGGMTLHYDTTLPSAMRKLTGDAGERVEMGVHKNADAAYKVFDAEGNEQSPRYTDLADAQESARQKTEDTGIKHVVKTTDGSPVFRNPDGTPKSSITGMSYDISKAVQTMREQGGFTLTEKSRSPHVKLAGREGDTPFVPKSAIEKGYVDAVGNTGESLAKMLSDPSYGTWVSSLAKDFLEIAPEALRRVKVGLWNTAGAHAFRTGARATEVRLNAATIDADGPIFAIEALHELGHGLLLHEMDNPVKKEIVDKITALRERVIDGLPKDMREAYDKAQASGWYQRHAAGDTQTLASLHPDENKASVIYSLLNNDEFVTQGWSDEATRAFLQQRKRKGSWWNNFVRFTKALIGLGEKTDDNAFAELMSYNSQLLRNAEGVASFHNFAERYFEGLGHSRQSAAARAQQALGVVMQGLPGVDKMALFDQMARTPKLAADAHIRLAERQLIQALQNSETKFEVDSVLRNSGHDDLDELIRNGLEGADVSDALSLLPDAAQEFVFAKLLTWNEILDGVAAAASEKNATLKLLSNPKALRGPVKDAQKAIARLLETEAMLDRATEAIAKMSRIEPAGLVDGLVEDAKAAPAPGRTKSYVDSAMEFIGGAVGKLGGNKVLDFLGKPAQFARTDSRWAEGYALTAMDKPQAQHAAHDALNAFSYPIENGVVKQTYDANLTNALLKTMADPAQKRAIDEWIWQTQNKGKETGKTVLLPDTDPDVAVALSKLTPTQRANVTDIVNRIGLVNAKRNEWTLGVMKEIAGQQGTSIAMRGSGLSRKDATLVSQTLLEAVTADFADPAAATRANALLQQVQAKLPLETFGPLLQFMQMQAEKLAYAKKLFADNPYWVSARRVGRYEYTYKDANGKLVRGQAETEKEARHNAKGRPLISLEKRADDDAGPVMGNLSDEHIQRFQQYERNEREMLAASGLATPELLDLMDRLSPAAMMARDAAQERHVDPLLVPKRGLRRGAEELPWMQNFITGVFRNATYWQRRLTKIRSELLLNDPEVMANPELRARMKEHFDGYFYPDTEFGQTLSKVSSVWGLGYNVATSIANLAQTGMRLFPELVRMTGEPITALRELRRAWGDFIGTTKFGASKKWNTPEEEWFMRQAESLGQVSATIFDENQFAQSKLASDYMDALRSDKPKTLGEWLTKAGGAYANAGMMLFRHGERLNNSISLIAAYRTLKKKNPTWTKEQLRDEAFLINSAVNDVGGRANRPVGAFANKQPFSRSLAMAFNTLQSYTLGSTHQLIRYLKEGGFGREAAGLTPAEKYAARKAAVSMLAVQFAAAGVLGLPFASAVVGLLDDSFPELEVKKNLRQWIHDAAQGDPTLTDMFMSGVPSMLGWDFQPRLSMGNNLPGVSDLSGFRPEQLLGPPAGQIGKFLRGATEVARGNLGAATTMAPPAWQKIAELAINRGKILDYRNRPSVEKLTPGEGVGVALGFQPTRVSKLNYTDRVLKQATEVANRRESDWRQTQAEALLEGNIGTVKGALRQRLAEDPNYDVDREVGEIVRKAEELSFPRDLRREGGREHTVERSRLLESFGIGVGSVTETDRFNFRQKLRQRLGVPDRELDLRRQAEKAALMDQLRQSHPELTRAELSRRVDDLLRRSLRRVPELQWLES